MTRMTHHVARSVDWYDVVGPFIITRLYFLMASSEGVGKGVKPASELTAEDLIRVFNDPDGELHHYDFVMKEEPAIGVSKI